MRQGFLSRREGLDACAIPALEQAALKLVSQSLSVPGGAIY